MTLNEQVEKVLQNCNQRFERRLNEIGSLVKGNQDFQADRISDVLDQIEEVREMVRAQETKLVELASRVERIAKFLNEQKVSTTAERKERTSSQ